MKKSIICLLLAALLLLSALAPAAMAAENDETTPEASGKFGDGFSWVFEDGTLTITGKGYMEAETPWEDYEEDIRRVVFEGGVTHVGPAVFRGCKAIRNVDFGDSMQEIGDQAFQNCTGLTKIELPESFRRFGVSSFEGCTSLAKVICNGYMPNFRSNCLWNGGKINVYYSPDRVWGIDDVMTLERNFAGRLEVLCQDGTDPIGYLPGDGEFTVPTSPEEEETEPATEETTVPTTAVTEPPVTTVPVTAAETETVPVTTVPETTVPATTEAVTEPVQEVVFTFATEPVPTEPEKEESALKGSVVGLLLVVGVITFFLTGALLFKLRGRKDRY